MMTRAASAAISAHPSVPAGAWVERRHRSFMFGRFLLQPERQLLLGDGMPVRIGGRALDILTALVERAGELLSKEELLSHAWPGIFVEESNLKVNMAGLRRILGENPATPSFIATVVGRGYRFVAPVKRFRDGPETVAALPPARRDDAPNSSGFNRWGEAPVISYNLSFSLLPMGHAAAER